jgi:hypothetical protein
MKTSEKEQKEIKAKKHDRKRAMENGVRISSLTHNPELDNTVLRGTRFLTCFKALGLERTGTV